MPSVHKSEIAMTPDETVVWDLYDIPAIGALIVSSATCDTSVIKLMVEASRKPNHYARTKKRLGEKGESGAHGTVYREHINGQHVALKLFHEPSEPDNEYHQGLSGIRANVALSAGLARLAATGNTTFSAKPVHPETAAAQTARFTVTTPHYHAALLSTAEHTATVWAMSYEDGIATDSNKLTLPVPRYPYYAEVLDAALETVGLDPFLVQYDVKNGNLLARPSQADGVDAEIVKLDCFADDYLDF